VMDFCLDHPDSNVLNLLFWITKEAVRAHS